MNGDMHIDYTLVNYIDGGVDFGSNVIFGDPKFVIFDNPRFNDENRSNYRLKPDSPAINAGNSSLVDSYPFNKNFAGQVVDLELKTRVNMEIDLGPFESN